MGWVSCLGTCVACYRPFMFNPHKVPSIRIDGVRQPVCKECVDRCNPQRIANGLPPIVPAADAYEPIDENQL